MAGREDRQGRFDDVLLLVGDRLGASDRGAAAANPAARAAPTFLPETLSARTGLAIASSERSVHASNTTTTVTGTRPGPPRRPHSPDMRGRRSRSLWAGTTTTISRKVWASRTIR